MTKLSVEQANELEKSIYSGIKNVIDTLNVEIERPEKIDQSIKIRLKVDSLLFNHDYDYLVAAIHYTLNKYTLNDIEQWIDYQYQNFFIEAFNTLYLDDLKKSINRQIQSSKLVQSLSNEEIEQLLKNIIFNYEFDNTQLVSNTYDKLEEYVYHRFNNTLTLKHINTEDYLDDWFKNYEEYMFVSERLSDLPILQNIDFMELIDDLRDHLDEFDVFNDYQDLYDDNALMSVIKQNFNQLSINYQMTKTLLNL